MLQHAAKPYPTTLFISIFSSTTVDANADRTKKVVETGIPILVNIKVFQEPLHDTTVFLGKVF